MLAIAQKLFLGVVQFRAAIPLPEQRDLRVIVRTMAVVVLEGNSVLLHQIGDARIVQSPVRNVVRGAAAAGASIEDQPVRSSATQDSAKIIDAQSELGQERIVARQITLQIVAQGIFSVSFVKPVHFAMIPLGISGIPAVQWVWRLKRLEIVRADLVLPSCRHAVVFDTRIETVIMIERMVLLTRNDDMSNARSWILGRLVRF